MYVLMTYDVQAKRTVKFMKLLRKYLEHVQYSVFSGDLPEGKLIELRREISRLLEPGERVTEITAANRKNVKVAHYAKSDSCKGEAKKTEDRSPATDFKVLRVGRLRPDIRCEMPGSVVRGCESAEENGEGERRCMAESPVIG
ncbi:MAG: CRISPR-associated endonuclease Cas2 [Desulfococcaceae bacterium]